MKKSRNNLQSRMSGESPNAHPESKSQGLGIVVYNILRDCLKPNATYRQSYRCVK